MAHTPRLHLFTGKGGVGKTHAACLFATALAGSGRKVLLAEVNGGGRVHAHFGVAPADYQVQAVPSLPGLYLLDIYAAAATREYAMMILRFEAIYRAIFENQVVRRFIRLVPSLGELTMLGKIWFHTQPAAAGELELDDLVVDLPATGHALAMLGAPQAVRNTVAVGPMHEQGVRLHSMLTHPELTRLHVVSRAENMPITEALEIVAGCRALGVPLGAMVVNHTTAPLPDGALEAVARLDPHGPLQRLPAALARREARRREGALQLQRLGAEALASAIRLPHLTAWEANLAAMPATAAPFAGLATAAAW